MEIKTIFEVEYIIKTPPKVLDNVLFTIDGIAEWFCDNVHVRDDIYTFEWDGYTEHARLLELKQGQFIKWQWLEDEESGLETEFGFRYHIDPITDFVVLTVTGSSTPEELEETKALWDQHINDLKRLIGA